MPNPFLDLPKIVSRFSVLNQTGPFPDIVLFTPTSDETVRISLYVDVSPSHTGTQFNASLSWTDDFNSIPGVGVGVGSLGPPSGEKSYRARIKGNTNLILSSAGTDSNYGPLNLYVVVESL